MKVIVAGGGSGGHVTPLLAVISELKKKYQAVKIVFVGSKGGIENKLIPEDGIKTRTISSGKFRRYHRSRILNIIDENIIVPKRSIVWLPSKKLLEKMKLIF